MREGAIAPRSSPNCPSCFARPYAVMLRSSLVGTAPGFYLCGVAGIAQLVEHNLAKVGVAGSSPVSRSFRRAIEDGRSKLDGGEARLRPTFPRFSLCGALHLPSSIFHLYGAGMAKVARRKGLKIPRGQPHPSSNLGPGIMFHNDLRRLHVMVD
jgi:hypothetical protein